MQLGKIYSLISNYISIKSVVFFLLGSAALLVIVCLVIRKKRKLSDVLRYMGLVITIGLIECFFQKYNELMSFCGGFAWGLIFSSIIFPTNAEAQAVLQAIVDKLIYTNKINLDINNGVKTRFDSIIEQKQRKKRFNNEIER